MLDIESYVTVYQAAVKMLGFFWPLVAVAVVMIIWDSHSGKPGACK